MKKRIKALKEANIKQRVNIGGTLFLIMFVYSIYRILLVDDILPFSISAVQTSMNHWLKHWHILSVGLLPIYVAFVFFGAGLCGFILGSTLQRWVSRYFHQKSD